MTTATVWAADSTSAVTYGVRVVVNGIEQQFADDMRPFIVDGRTFLSVRGIADALGIAVDWDDETATVYIGQRAISGGGQLRVAVPHLPISLDPAGSNDSATALAAAQIFDTLVKLDYDTMEIMPNLAISWDMPDAMTVDIELRRDVVFHNGDRLIARDVQFTLQFAATFAETAIFAAHIDSVTVHDDYNLTIHLDRPFVPILRNLALPHLGIVPAEVFGRDGWDNFYNHPIGSGPFKFESFVFGQYMTLARNENYWGAPAGVESMQFIQIADASSRAMSVADGLADIALMIAPDDATLLESDPDINILHRPNLAISDYIAFNTQIEPFNNPLVTRAISYALDVQEILYNSFGRHTGTIITTPLPNTVWGHTEIAPFDTNLDHARQLLAAAGYPNGFETTIWWNMGNFNRLHMAENVQMQLAQVGISVEVIELDWPTVLDGGSQGLHDMFLPAGQLYQATRIMHYFTFSTRQV